MCDHSQPKNILSCQAYLTIIANIYVGVTQIPMCKDCKFYTPIDETKGDCFGIEVPANMNANDCPQKAFQAIESNDRH